jgi:hypothetical protein
MDITRKGSEWLLQSPKLHLHQILALDFVKEAHDEKQAKHRDIGLMAFSNCEPRKAGRQTQEGKGVNLKIVDNQRESTIDNQGGARFKGQARSTLERGRWR